MASKFYIGKGTKVYVALPALGDTTEPVEVTLTTEAASTAKDTTAPATITLSAAVASGKFIAAGNYLSFVAPTTGKQVLVKVTADVEPGDTTITVDTIPEAIAASSVAKFPLQLYGRTSANIGRSGSRTSTVDFDSDGYGSGLTTSIEQTFTMNGNWLPLDAGFATAEHIFTELLEGYFWIEMPKISSAYTKGRVYHGAGSITSLPLEIPADGIITGNIEGAFNGKPRFKADTPV